MRWWGSSIGRPSPWPALSSHIPPDHQQQHLSTSASPASRFFFSTPSHARCAQQQLQPAPCSPAGCEAGSTTTSPLSAAAMASAGASPVGPPPHIPAATPPRRDSHGHADQDDQGPRAPSGPDLPTGSSIGAPPPSRQLGRTRAWLIGAAPWCHHRGGTSHARSIGLTSTGGSPAGWGASNLNLAGSLLLLHTYAGARISGTVVSVSQTTRRLQTLSLGKACTSIRNKQVHTPSPHGRPADGGRCRTAGTAAGSQACSD